jgi:hypothetical protein
VCALQDSKKKNLPGIYWQRFDVRVAVPFDKSLAEGLSKRVRDVVMACPTGRWRLSLINFDLPAPLYGFAEFWCRHVRLHRDV